MSAYNHIKNQYYIPKHLQRSQEETERLLKELDDKYRPFLREGTGEMPKAEHPAQYMKAIVVDKLPITRWFVYNKEEKKLQTAKRQIRFANRFLKSDYRLIEDRHLKIEEYSFMKRNVNKRTQPYHLDELEKDIRNTPQQIDMFDIGGCGCFIDM